MKATTFPQGRVTVDAGVDADVGALIGDVAVAVGASGRPADNAAADVDAVVELAAVDTVAVEAGAGAEAVADAGVRPR
mgnify:CR=1 FL=1